MDIIGPTFKTGEPVLPVWSISTIDNSLSEKFNRSHTDILHKQLLNLAMTGLKELRPKCFEFSGNIAALKGLNRTVSKGF